MPFVDRVANLLPGSAGHLGLETIALERRVAKLEGPLSLAVRENASKSLFNQGADGRMLAGRKTLRLFKQSLRNLYGRLHMGRHIILHRIAGKSATAIPSLSFHHVQRDLDLPSVAANRIGSSQSIHCLAVMEEQVS